MATQRIGGNGLTYITPDEIKEAPLEWQRRGLQYTATGYGKRIPTTRMARVGKRWHRIYCAIFSNSGTCYIESKGKDLIVEES